MRVVRAPLRITLGGGGTDLVNGSGYCIAAAIDHYVTIAVNHPFTDDYILRYSSIERVKRVEDIDHTLIRRVLDATNTPPGIEISSMADIPAGTGLGSSGAFTVGLLGALCPHLSRPALAHLACDLDVGQQDQHAAVYGGVHAYDFVRRTLRPIDTDLDEHLQLFYTGQARVSAPVPTDAIRAYDQAHAAVSALEANDPELLGNCLLDQWQTKLNAQHNEFHEGMDRVIHSALKLGAYGGKLIGAGNGGFLLFAGKVDPIPMGRMGLVEVPFTFDYSGVTTL